VRFKLDENLDPRAKEILAQAAHEVRLVEDEGLEGAPDVSIGQAAILEGLCLVTLDLDFANVVAFPPHQYRGIIVIRHPRPTVMGLLSLVHQLVDILRTQDPTGKLWIVEPGRLRVHEPIEPWGEEEVK
jgi:hypothetical protein